MTIRHKTVKEFAKMWKKTEKTIYLRITEQKLYAQREPGGQGILIPVCDCKTQMFPDKALCDSCRISLQGKLP